MNWALKRQIFYILLLFLILAGLGFLLIYPQFQKAPTCTDGIQNGTETGIDCGGSCPNACSNLMSPLSVLWARAFEVVPGRYNAIAYISNHNKNAAIEKINYRFRFADANNIYIGMREGSTFVPPGGNFAVFVPAIDVGNSVPVYVTFEFTDQNPQWIQVSQNKIDQLKILVSNMQLSDPDSLPKLSATVKNNSLFTIPDINVVAILYDKSGNAVSGSSTYLTSLSPLQSSAINFTWQEPFSNPVVKQELIPIFDISSVNTQ